MRGIGDRLRARARELELSDSEVARRLGLSQARYANYVAETREPDFETLLRICRVLAVTPDEVLGVAVRDRPEEDRRLHERIAAAAESMDPATLGLAADLMDTLARHAAPTHASTAPGSPGLSTS